MRNLAHSSNKRKIDFFCLIIGIFGMNQGDVALNIFFQSLVAELNLYP